MISKNRKIKVIVVLLFLASSFLIINKLSFYKFQFLGHYSNKIYGHRVNTLDKLSLAEKKFIGAELDLVYNDSLNYFDVRHPPRETINLTLESYLSSIERIDFKLWLDIKNLNNKNAKKILNKLNGLFKDSKLLKRNILVETESPDALVVFKDSDYHLSYYLPYLHVLDKKKQKSALKNIKEVLQSQPELGISCHYLSYNLMHENFPNTRKYVWVTGKSQKIKDFFIIRRMLSDKFVDIVLVSF